MKAVRSMEDCVHASHTRARTEAVRGKQIIRELLHTYWGPGDGRKAPDFITRAIKFSRYDVVSERKARAKLRAKWKKEHPDAA